MGIRQGRILLAGLAAVLILGGAVVIPSAPANAAPAATALEILETLPVKGRAPMTGYSRDQFGGSWRDVDGSGCDTRSDILRRDLVERVMSSRCGVMSGVLFPDPFTGNPLTYVRGASVVDVDHVVSGAATASGILT